MRGGLKSARGSSKSHSLPVGSKDHCAWPFLMRSTCSSTTYIRYTYCWQSLFFLPPSEISSWALTPKIKIFTGRKEMKNLEEGKYFDFCRVEEEGRDTKTHRWIQEFDPCPNAAIKPTKGNPLWYFFKTDLPYICAHASRWKKNWIQWNETP